MSHRRDHRERSPSRDDRSRSNARRDYTTSRDQNERSHSSRDRGRGDHGTSNSSSSVRGSNSYQGTRPSAQSLAEVPTVVPIPSTGRALPDPTFPTSGGAAGRAMTVKVNHFRLQSLPANDIYQYELVFCLSAESQRKGSDKVSAYNQTRAMVKGAHLFGEDFVFDGVSRGWSPVELLKLGDTKTAVLNVDTGLSVQVTIRAEKLLRFGTFVAHVKTGRAGVAPKDPYLSDCLAFLGALFRHGPTSNPQLVTRPNSTAYFNRLAAGACVPLASTGNVLEAIRGIFQSVSIGFGTLCVNVDVCSGTFYVPDRPLIGVAQAFAGLDPHQDPSDSRNIRQFVHNGCSRLVGVFFCVKHLKTSKNSKRMRVAKISDVDAKNLTFELITDNDSNTKKTISVYDYFRDRYQIVLKHPHLPLLITRAGAFPLELCYTAPGERYKEALQGRETADFIKFSTSPAYVREAQIKENVQKLEWHHQKILKAAGVSVAAKRFLEVPARVLECPTPEYGKSTGDRHAPSGGSWNLKNKRFVGPESYLAYGLCYFPDGRNLLTDQLMQRYIGALRSGCSSVGLQVPQGPPTFLQGNPIGDIAEVVKNIYQKTGNFFRRTPQLLLFILHEKTNPAVYKAIKYTTEVELGIPSQVFQAEKLRTERGWQQYVANIAMKINAKLGGLNHIVPPIPFLTKFKVMQIGIDVSHPSPAERRRIPPPPSFAAMVGSYDKTCALYTAVVTAQDAGVELVQAQQTMFKELLSRYSSKNRNGYPEVVIVWRDGLSDSMIDQFKETELAALKEVRRAVDGNFKIVAVNCIKRTHTRIFPTTKADGDKLGNCPPGTCVEFSTGDSDCDMFMITAAALQGTINPCRYQLIDSELKLSKYDLPNLVMHSCFQYARATRSVSQHPAAMYAHLVADKARSRLSRDDKGQVILPDVHKNLRFTMYFQ